MTRYIEDLNENTAPVAGDFLLCYDASAGATDKDRKVNVSKFAVLAVANTFTTTQTITPATDVVALELRMPSGNTSKALRALYNSIERMNLNVTASASVLAMTSYDAGAGSGPTIGVGRNSNAGTAAPGTLYATQANNSSSILWPDNSGVWRTVQDTGITSANFASAGSVVGAQTSSLDSKDVIEEFTDYDGALAAILDAPLYDFTYKNGRFGGEKFTGIITDYSPIFGMDRDAAHPAGKSLNEVTAFGYTAAAFKAVVRRLQILERNNHCSLK